MNFNDSSYLEQVTVFFPKHFCFLPRISTWSLWEWSFASIGKELDLTSFSGDPIQEANDNH